MRNYFRYPKLALNKLTSSYKNIVVRYPKIFKNIIVVNEYPRSGGNWLCRILSDLLNIPFKPHKFFPPNSHIVHGHFSYNPDMKNVILMIRDGRDIMVSYYYYCLVVKDNKANLNAVMRHRNKLNFNDVQDVSGNLPKFIEYAFSSIDFPPFTWREFMEQWMDKGFPVVRFEDLLSKAPEVLEDLLKSTSNKPNVDNDFINMVVDNHSFKKAVGRQPGDEKKNSHLRKGIAGDWKTKFSRAAREIFDHYAGDTLIEFGYEPDRSWVHADLQQILSRG